MIVISVLLPSMHGRAVVPIRHGPLMSSTTPFVWMVQVLGLKGRALA